MRSYDKSTNMTDYFGLLSVIGVAWRMQTRPSLNKVEVSGGNVNKLMLAIRCAMVWSTILYARGDGNQRPLTADHEDTV